MSGIVRHFLDRDHDGRITMNDFSMISNSMNLGSIGQFGFRQGFNYLDRNRDGVIDNYELNSAINMLTNHSNHYFVPRQYSNFGNAPAVFNSQYPRYF